MFQSLQICRALAALMVVLFHAGGNLARESYFGAAAAGLEAGFWALGDAGVAFFFVLSGFIIAHVHGADLGQPQRVGSYLRRRALRIYPSYWIVYVAVCLAALNVPSLRSALPDDLDVLLFGLTLLPMDPAVVGGTGAPVLFVAWSLQYELLFYLAFAVAIVDPRAFILLLLGWVAFFWQQSGVAHSGHPADFLGNPLISLFLMGMLAATWARRGVLQRHADSLALCGGLVFLLLCGLATQLRQDYDKPLFDLAFGLSSACLILGVVQWERRQPRRESKAWLALGEASYVLYLVHVPVISLCSKLGAAHLPKTTGGAVTALALAVGASVVGAVIFHRLIERPLLRRLSRRREPAAAQAGPRRAAPLQHRG